MGQSTKRGPHVWTVMVNGAVVYMGTRLVDAMAAFGDPDQPANVSVLYRDGRRLDLNDGQPTLL